VAKALPIGMTVYTAGVTGYSEVTLHLESRIAPEKRIIKGRPLE
jgi:hypothetical protein